MSTSSPLPTPDPNRHRTHVECPEDGHRRIDQRAQVGAGRLLRRCRCRRNGTYHVSPSNQMASDSLWIGSALPRLCFDARRRPSPCAPRPRAGSCSTGWRSPRWADFEDGAHDQTWDGFRFANMRPDYTGMIEVGCTPRGVLRTTSRRATSRSRRAARVARRRQRHTLDHAFYIGQALDPGPHDLAFEDITVAAREPGDSVPLLPWRRSWLDLDQRWNSGSDA